jgi:TolB-like protein/DNA-binding winged helix-turn-helix (wHTH) protein/Tfp pilus assembly protein PilF
MNDLGSTPLFFGAFRLHPEERTLVREGRPITLTPKEFDTLVALVEARGRVVGKDELMSRVWPDSYVGEGSLARNISILRKALGDDVIETVPRRGYRLAIPVATSAPPPATAATAERNPAPPTEQIPEPAVPAGLPSQNPAAASMQLGRYTRPVAYASLVALVLVLVVLLNRSSVSHAKVNALPGPVRIAVLPFLNYTGNPQDDYLCDGMTEATISELSRLNPGQLIVIARTSAMKFKNTDQTIPQIATELNADYILESSVRGSGDRLRITTQLVRGSDASHLWTGEFERRVQNVLDVQQQVSIAVAEETRLSLDNSVRKRLHDATAVDSEAYQDYLLGRFYWNKRNREGLFKSLEYFERAIAREPRFAQAYAGLADSYLLLGGGYLPDIATYNKARVAALKAVELDNTLSDAYASLAYEKFVNEHDMPGADENYQRALMLDPNNANAHHWYALYLSAMKRTEEAILQIHLAQELDPLAIGIRYNAAWVYLAAGRFDEAILLAKRALELDPDSAPAHGTLGAAFQAKGLYEQAVAEFQTAQKLRADYSPYAVEVAHTYAMEGKSHRARSLLASLLLDSRWGNAAPYSFAVTYAALGQKDSAFQWLQRCVDDRSCTANELNNDPGLNPLRSDPRFLQIAR